MKNGTKVENGFTQKISLLYIVQKWWKFTLTLLCQRFESYALE